MARAIEEASRARGRTSPNPMVGAVLTRDGEIIGTGFHPEAGEDHAEIRALDAVSGSAEGATMYVNLEPCCHHGRTPPCTESLIQAGVHRVVVAMEDPDPRVSGQGLEALRQAGIEVEVGILEEEARELNRAYLTSVAEDRPFVALKYAMTADGKIATTTGESKWITGETSRRRVHTFRDEYDAVLVGKGTLLADDPRLTCRIDEGRDPVRAAIDMRLEAPPESRLFDSKRSEAQTVVYCGPGASSDKRRALADRGVDIVQVGVDAEGRAQLEDVVEDLHGRDLLSLMVEGGGGLAASLIDQNLVDRVYAFVAPKIAGGETAVTPVEGDGVESMADARQLEPVGIDRFDGDVMLTYDL
jgi:diaminohydroxyphosphoribosylaminopyrimidine deaminase/5-amino-6-(5-phosphoribosylamino)uracil reductase